MSKLLKMVGVAALFGALMMAGGCGGGGGGEAPVVTNPSATVSVPATVNTDGTATTGANTTTVTAPSGTTGYLADVSATLPPSTVITAKNPDGTTKALTAPPTLTFTVPADSSSTQSGTNGVPPPPGYTLYATAGAVNIQVTGAASATFNPPITVTMPVPGRAVGAVVTVHAVKDGSAAYVLLGNFTVTTPGFLTFPVSDLCWQIGRAPTVESTSPADGATNVPINTIITATFSEPMNRGKMTELEFKLNGPDGAPVSGRVTYANGVATFTPSSSLLSGTTYTAKIEVEAENEAHNRLTRRSDGRESEYKWTFTTAPTGSGGGTT
jgi:hypothetical protein